jgi:hypothetical protein
VVVTMGSQALNHEVHSLFMYRMSNGESHSVYDEAYQKRRNVYAMVQESTLVLFCFSSS